MQIHSKKLVLGGGCFWCLEAVFRRVNGVIQVTSGYTGGTTFNPSYHEVCSGHSGHAEVVEIVYDDTMVSLSSLLSVFFAIHDPTTLNRQGNDQGTQYRSIVCYSNDDEKRSINDIIKYHQKDFDATIVTQIAALTHFYPSEIEHHDYYEKNSSQPYCQMVIKPKLDKLVQWKADNS